MTAVIFPEKLRCYDMLMKPAIPDTGWVISVDGDTAVVSLRKVSACKGCGAGKMGLCNPSGNLSSMTVRNSLGAVPGDQVKLGLSPSVQRMGFFLAFVLPLISFLAGSLAGHLVNRRMQIPFLDAFSGFISLALSLAFSLLRLRKLDRSSGMMIKDIVSGCLAMNESKSEEERRFEGYA